MSTRTISRRSLLLAALQQPAFKTDVKVVNVFATVHDKKGAILRDLKQDDFVLEDEGRPQVIRYFARENDLPLTLGLLVDTSMSQRRVLGEERAASHKFFELVLRENKDQAFVLHFDREAELLRDLTSSRKELEEALAQLELPELRSRPRPGPGNDPGVPPGGRHGWGAGTVLYDSVLLACDELMRKQGGRKALILLTDGVDNGSRVSIEAAVDSGQRAGTLVYSVLFADAEGYGRYPSGMGGHGRHSGMGRRGGGRPLRDRPDGKKVLQRISKETGGGFFEVSKKHPLDQIYARVEEELRNQYSLGYTPDPPGSAGEFRRISVTAKQKGAIVQAREGYYVAR